MKTVVGKLSRGLQVRVLPGAPILAHNIGRNMKSMVGVAQLVEPQIVILAVAGSSPVAHPN